MSDQQPDHYLVRVDRKMVEQLTEHESEPLVLISIDALGDGTHMMVLKRPEDSGPRA